jgi:hypothetical protein
MTRTQYSVYYEQRRGQGQFRCSSKVWQFAYAEARAIARDWNVETYVMRTVDTADATRVHLMAQFSPAGRLDANGRVYADAQERAQAVA